MKPIAVIGIVLILCGVGGLAFSRVSWTETKPVVKAGPIEVNREESHSVWIPTAAGIAAIVVGAGLVIVGRRA